MPTTPLLGITELTPNQTGKEATINSAILALEAAQNASLAVSMAAGDVTLSVAQFTSNFIFNVSGQTANRILNIPAQVNGVNSSRVFCVRNTSATYTVQVQITGGAGAVMIVPIGGTYLLSADGAGNIVLVQNPLTQTPSFSQAVGNRNAVLLDAENVVEMNVAVANSFTIPADASVNFPIGTMLTIIQTGAGQTTIAPAAGVTLNSRGGLVMIAGAWGVATVIKRSANTWLLTGDLA